MTLPLLSRHQWVVGPRDASERVSPRLNQSVTVDAHRHLRGPYTAAGALVRHLVADAHLRVPELVRTYSLTLVSVAPETPSLVPVPEAVLKAFDFPREGNPPDLTFRLANGVTDFLLAYFAHAYAARGEITFLNMHEADALDREFVAVLLRRSDPGRLRLRIHTDSDDIREPLRSALASYAAVVRGRPPESAANADRVFARMDPAERATLARRYVDSECTADDPLLLRAYRACDDDTRRQLHLDRLDVLKGFDEPSLALGAIPLHCERSGTAVDAIAAASLHCLRMAYYDACFDLASRGRRLADPVAERDTFGHLTRHMLFSLLMLRRLDEMVALCRECDEMIDDPFVLAHCAYARAIMHLRFLPPEQQELPVARAWTEKALAFTHARPPSANRIVNLAFLRNTMALVEMKGGRAALALEMLDGAIAFLHAEATPDSFALECPILYRNRALLNDRVGNTAAAVADLMTMLRYEFSDAWAHLQLAAIHRRCGRYAQALEQSNLAIEWSPPWTAAYHHRALVYADLRRPDAALADYERVLTLDPLHADTFSDRATLLYQLARFDESRADVERGLELRPTGARLLCLRGYLERREGRTSDARRSFQAALGQTPPLPERVAAAVRRWLASA